MIPQDQVRECADRCAKCGSKARLVTLKPAALIECESPKCFNAITRPDLEQAITRWNVKQRSAKK